MLEYKILNPLSPERPLVERLYEDSFPPNERRPLEPLLQNSDGRSLTLSLWYQNRFCGFMVVLTYKDIAHIIYFAVKEELRGRRLGSKALELLRNIRPGDRIIADLEVEREGAPNNEQRRLRREFYLRNGYTVSPVHYSWRGEPYEILISGGDITDSEFREFWDSFD